MLRHPSASALAVAAERASLAIGRLDQALAAHPLRAAFLYRARLEAVRHQAASDGHAIDPWHLAATLEGLRLRLDPTMRLPERAATLEAARFAYGLHQWLAAPDPSQEEAIARAACALEAAEPAGSLLGAASGAWAWLAAGGGRAPLRAALVRHWQRLGFLHAPAPLTGTAAFAADPPPLGEAEWAAAFFPSVQAEAEAARDLLRSLERAWRDARAAGSGQRRTSRAPLAIDLLAAAPLLSAQTLARATGITEKGAIEMLAGFAERGIVVEVTHRSSGRLFGLAGMTPLVAATAAPKRPVPGRGPGRPSARTHAEPDTPPPLPAPADDRPPLALRAPPIDYAALDAAITRCEQTIRTARAALDSVAKPAPPQPAAGRSEYVEQIQQDDDWDRNPEQP